MLSLLPKKDYLVINDLLLQSGGHSTQIDHVVVSVFGVFVIETKYYKVRTVNSGHRISMVTNTNSVILYARTKVMLGLL